MAKLGRPYGAKSSKTEQWERFSDWLMAEGLVRFQKEMSKLKGKDYVLTVKDLMEYFQPKLARTELTGEGGKPLLLLKNATTDNSKRPNSLPPKTGRV